MFNSEDEEEHFDCTPPSSSSSYQIGRELLKRNNNNQSWGIIIKKRPKDITINEIQDDSIAFVSELKAGFIINSVNGKQSYNEISNEISSKDRLALDLVYSKPTQSLRRLSPKRVSANILLPTQNLSQSNNNLAPTATTTTTTITTTTTTSTTRNLSEVSKSTPTSNKTTTLTSTNPTSKSNPTNITTTRNQPEIIDLVMSDDDEPLPRIMQVASLANTQNLQITRVARTAAAAARDAQNPIPSFQPNQQIPNFSLQPRSNNYRMASNSDDDDDDDDDEMSYESDWEANYLSMFPLTSTNAPSNSRVQNSFPRPSTSEVINLLSSDDEDTTPAAIPTNSTVSAGAIVRKKRKAKEEASNDKDVKRIKVKKENERLQLAFGEANIDDEVVEVKAPEVTNANDTSNGDIMELDDTGDEIAFVGGNMQVMSDLPHRRYECTIHVFVADSNSKNSMHCTHCFCYICDVEAKNCDEWKSHCNATHKNEFWKKQKEIRKLKVFKHLKSSELTKLLKDNERVFSPNFYAPANMVMGLQINTGHISTYFSEMPLVITEKADIFFRRTSIALPWSINDPSIMIQLVTITSSIIKFLQVAKAWPTIYTSSVASSEQNKNKINKILIRIILRCRDSSELITSVLDDIRPLENVNIDKIIRYFMTYLRKTRDDRNNDTSIINFLVETLAAESGTNHLIAVADVWPTCIFYVVCTIAKSNSDLRCNDSAIIIENLIKKISDPQLNVIQNMQMLTSRKALSNIFLIEAFVRNISLVQESNKTLLVSLTNLMLDKILVCCDFMNKLQSVGVSTSTSFIDHVNIKEVEVWINKLDEYKFGSVHELLGSQEYEKYDSIAIAVCIRAIRFEMQHTGSSNYRPNYPTSKLNLTAATVLAQVAVSFSSSLVESEMDIDSSSILTVTTNESSTSLATTLQLQYLSIASNAVVRYMSSVENLDTGVKEIIKNVPVELLNEWMRVPRSCDPHEVENPTKDNLGVSLNDYCAKSLSKLLISSPELFKHQIVSQNYKQALMIVWKSQLSEYLEKGNDMKTLNLSYFLDAIEYISGIVKEADVVQVFQEYNFVFKMSSNLVLCRKVHTINKDLLRLIIKARNLVDTFSNDSNSNTVDINRRSRVVKLWSTLYGRISPLALSTYVLLSDWKSLATYSIEKPSFFFSELRKLFIGINDLYKLTDDEIIRLAEIFSASASHAFTKKIVDADMKVHLTDFNNEATFLNRAIQLAPTTFVTIALDALNNSHLTLLIEQLKASNQTHFIDRIKEEFIKEVKERAASNVLKNGFRSYPEQYLLSLSLNLYKEAIQFVEFHINGLSNSKVLIGALSHVLHAKHQLEEALDAVTPLMAGYRLKNAATCRELDIFIEENHVRWNELLAVSLRFLELNFYYKCDVESIEKCMKYRSSSSSDDIAISTHIALETRISNFLENSFKAKKIKPVEYLKIALLFFSKNKIEKLLVMYIGNRDIYKKDVFSDLIVTCLEHCSKSINLRELLYGFVAKLILKRTDNPSDSVISEKAKSKIIAEVTMGGLSCSPDSLDFEAFTKYLDQHKDLKSAVLDFHESYYFLRLVTSPTIEAFEMVKKFKWFNVEQRQIFRCVLDCGSKGASILLNDRDGVMLTIEKLQQQILVQQKSNNLATECLSVCDGMTALTKALTREILQPSTIDGFAGLCISLESPFIRICKYLIAVSIYIVYIERELPACGDRILRLKSTVEELTSRIYVILDSNSLVQSILNMATKLDIDSFTSYSSECSKFKSDSITTKAKDLIDVFIIHAADRMMSPNQRIDLFRKLLHLCQHPTLSKDIKCLLPDRQLLTLSGSLNGEVIQPSMDSPKTLKFLIDSSDSVVEIFIQLIREEGQLAAQCIEEIINTRQAYVLKRLFMNKRDLFYLLSQHIKRLECLKVLYVNMTPDTPLDQSFNGDKFLTSLTTCPIQWKPFFDTISRDLLTYLIDAIGICNLENSELARKQMIQIFRVFRGYQPTATDKSLYNSLIGIEEIIKAKMANCEFVIDNTLKQFTSIIDFDPSNLLHFKTFADIIFFKNVLVDLLFSKTNGVMHVTIFQNIWKNMTNVEVILFDNLRTLWFKILNYMQHKTVTQGLKNLFQEFITFFNSILNWYRERGRVFWASISNESSRRFSNKPKVKNLIQSIVVKFT